MSAPASSAAAGGHFDLVVIGGGSGGLAAAKEAAKTHPGRKVLCLDFVAPSPAGTKWGLGGTCVNVGCIPKKLMHHAANVGRAIHNDAEQFGWDGVSEPKHDWARMQGLIGDYIHSLNYSYRSGLRGAGVTYAEAKASFDSATSLVYTTSAGKATRVTFDRAIVAAGGRPAFLPIPGWQLAQSSDDLFWRKTSPGKTLVIGAGYIALECAGFLQHIGLDVSIMVRGEVLRKMDRQSGQMIAELMERDGVRFIHPANPLSFRSLGARPPLDGLSAVSADVYALPTDAKGNQKLLHYTSGVVETRHAKPAGLVTYAPYAPGQIEVTFEIVGANGNKTQGVETFDTVLFATGRVCDPVPLGLAAAGVRVTPAGKVIVDAFEATSNPRVFAIGDVAAGVPSHATLAANPQLEPVDRPELTPVAIQAGQLLARRLWGPHEAAPLAANATPSSGVPDDALMDYANIATTVFTSPSEYAFVGMSEEQARLPRNLGGIGAENVEVYWSRFGNLEISPLHPHLPALRSKAFTGRQLWAEAYVAKNNLMWPELLFDPSGTTCRVMYSNPSKGGAEEPAAVTEQSVIPGKTANQGTVTYTIKLNDGLGDEVTNVPGSLLRLQDEVAVESAEVLYKANCLAKLIVDKSANERVVGLHFVGPSAGEVVQGFALAVSLGATKRQFDRLVGIHPTAAEEFSVLTVTQSSGATMLKQAGCGGGSCG